MKRAVLVVTDAPVLVLTETWLDLMQRETDLEPSEQLLADLRTLTTRPIGPAGWGEWHDAAARVRALLPEEDEA